MNRFKVAWNYRQETSDTRGALCLVLGINNAKRSWNSYKWVQAWGEIKHG